MRRSYIAYTITNVAQLVLPDGTPMVEWKFYLPTSHPNLIAKVTTPPQSYSTAATRVTLPNTSQHFLTPFSPRLPPQRP